MASSIGAAEVRDVNTPQTLQEYLRQAARNNAGLKAAFEEWKAALEAVPQAKALPDPMFTYAFFVEQVETRQRVGVMQTFPWFRTIQPRAADKAVGRVRVIQGRQQAAFGDDGGVVRGLLLQPILHQLRQRTMDAAGVRLTRKDGLTLALNDAQHRQGGEAYEGADRQGEEGERRHQIVAERRKRHLETYGGQDGLHPVEVEPAETYEQGLSLIHISEPTRPY